MSGARDIQKHWASIRIVNEPGKNPRSLRVEKLRDFP